MMITNKQGTQAVSNLNWEGKTQLWMFNLSEGRARLIDFRGSSRSPQIYEGEEDYFALVHDREDDQLSISVHSHGAIDKIASSIQIARPTPSGKAEYQNAKFAGDVSVWKNLPTAYLVHISRVPHIVLVDAGVEKVGIQALAWFDQTYNKDYQDILGLAGVPGTRLILASIQRDSRPVLYDPVDRNVVRKLDLAGRNGNPFLRFRRSSPELWASDYDTLVKVEAGSWSTTGTLRIQEPSPDGTGQFMGEFSFDQGERLCVAARPSSGDAVGIDTLKFCITHRAHLGGQPFEVAVLKDGTVVSRDWKSGALLTGRLQPVS